MPISVNYRSNLQKYINAVIREYITLYYFTINVVEQGIHLFYCLKIHEQMRKKSQNIELVLFL